MELRHIRYFLTLSEELHFKRAAEKLFIAQPALTRQIRELEKELGVMLFKRDKRNVSLSLEGKYLQEEAYKLLRHVDEIRTSIGQASKIGGTINIGTIGSAINVVIPDLIQQTDAQFPGVKMRLTEGTSQNLLNDLLDRKIDIAIGRPFANTPGIASEVIFEESTVVVSARNNRWKLDESSSIKDLAEVPFILFPMEAGSQYREHIVNSCQAAGFFPRISHESIHANTLLRLVEKDLGVTVIPQSLLNGIDLALNHFVMKGLDIPLQLAVSYRATDSNKTLRQIIDIIKESIPKSSML